MGPHPDARAQGVGRGGRGRGRARAAARAPRRASRSRSAAWPRSTRWTPSPRRSTLPRLSTGRLVVRRRRCAHPRAGRLRGGAAVRRPPGRSPGPGVRWCSSPPPWGTRRRPCSLRDRPAGLGRGRARGGRRGCAGRPALRARRPGAGPGGRRRRGAGATCSPSRWPSPGTSVDPQAGRPAGAGRGPAAWTTADARRRRHPGPGAGGHRERGRRAQRPPYRTPEAVAGHATRRGCTHRSTAAVGRAAAPPARPARRAGSPATASPRAGHRADSVDDLWLLDVAAPSEVEARRGAGAVRDLVVSALSRLADVGPAAGRPGPQAQASVLRDALGVPVLVPGTEAAAARAGALTTPGARGASLVLDLGGGTIDVVAPDGAHAVVAGAGEMVSAAVAAALGISRAAAEWVKRGPCARLETPHLALGEDGSRTFLARTAAPDAVGALAVPGPAGWLPFDRRLSPAEWRALRLRIKRAALSDNLRRAVQALDLESGAREMDVEEMDVEEMDVEESASPESGARATSAGETGRDRGDAAQRRPGTSCSPAASPGTPRSCGCSTRPYPARPSGGPTSRACSATAGPSPTGSRSWRSLLGRRATAVDADGEAPGPSCALLRVGTARLLLPNTRPGAAGGPAWSSVRRCGTVAL